MCPATLNMTAQTIPGIICYLAVSRSGVSTHVALSEPQGQAAGCFVLGNSRLLYSTVPQFIHRSAINNRSNMDLF